MVGRTAVLPPMPRCPYYSLSALLSVLLVVLSAKSNVAVVAAFLTENRFYSDPIPNVCTLAKQPSNVCGSRVTHFDIQRTILSAKTNDCDNGKYAKANDGANGKYFGALHRAVHTGDTRKLGVHQTFWVERCRELEEYKREHGNCDVPLPWNRREKGTQLQNWVRNQRTQYRFYQQDKKPCSMTEERIAILEDMGFKWEITGWQGENASWKMRYEELVEYKGKYGDCNVPRRWEKNPKLGIWVQNQRVEYRYLKEGKMSDMTDKRIAMLEDIGFEWYVNVEWELRYKELKQYKERYGNCNVPQRWKENPQLGRWVNTQRDQYRLLKEGKESQMTDERIEMLEKLEFDWYVKGPQVEWEMRYEELEQYRERYGNCNVPKGWKKNPPLANWVDTQRRQYRLLKEGKKSTMTAERIDMLEKIGFEWKVRRGRRRETKT